MANTFDTALKMLKARSKTTSGLRQALLRKGHDEAEVDAALRRLLELKYLDDARHASARASVLLAEGRAKDDAVRRLIFEGVDESQAAAAVTLSATESGHSDEAAAKGLIAKRKMSGVKAARWLLSRGFDEELVRRLCGLDG